MKDAEVMRSPNVPSGSNAKFMSNRTNPSTPREPHAPLLRPKSLCDPLSEKVAQKPVDGSLGSKNVDNKSNPLDDEKNLSEAQLAEINT